MGLLAIPLMFRQVLPLCLALLGAFVGLVVTSLAPPLGRNAEQLGPNIRVLLAIAAAVIAVVGAGIVASIQARSFGPSIDYLTRRERQQLPFIAALYCIDTTIAVLTLVAVAVRGTGVARPSALPAGIAVPPA